VATVFAPAEGSVVVTFQRFHNNGRRGGGSMRILVVCGAGASSTFVAQRLRHAAQAAGRRISALAGTERSLPIDLDAADIVLVGPHLQHALDRIGHEAEPRDVRVILLPEDVFTDVDGRRTLDLVDSALAAPDTPPTPTPTERKPA
jgi:PTS system cellobiose-specific IIB component